MGNIDFPTVGPSGSTRFFGRPVWRRRNWESPYGARQMRHDSPGGIGFEAEAED